jgi:hypothetical protein
MDQKVGKVTGPLVVMRIGHLSRLRGLNPLLVHGSGVTVLRCPIFPPRISSDFGLFMPDTASQARSFKVSTGTLEDRPEALDDDPFAGFVAAAGHTPGISVLGKEGRGVSMVNALYAPKREMRSCPMPGILQALGSMC